MDIKYRVPAITEIGNVSEQLMISYRAAYKGLMDKEYLSSLKENHWIPILQKCINIGDTCLIIDCNGEVVGSTVFSIIKRETYTYAELHAFYLLPQYIGLGLGNSFYQRIENEMISQDCNFCILEVLSTNTRAIQFYLSHGFIKIETFTVKENGMTLSCDKMKKNF